MADRMRRLWVPFRSGIVPLASAADAIVNITTLIDAAQGRTLKQYTVTRMIFGFSALMDSGGPGTFEIGVRLQNENIGVGVVDPLADITAEWIYWESVMAEVAAMTNQNRIFRDIRSQRKAQGSDQDLLFFVSQSTGVAGDFEVSGRCLVLIR